jgi:hypothetical protein
MPFLAFVVLLFSLIMATPVQAARVESWTFRGEITWKHPDGRTIRGTYADTRVDDDVLRIIRDDSGQRFFMEMKLVGNGTLLKNRAHFFVLDKPTTTNARKAHRISAGVWPGRGNTTGSLVSELTTADLGTLDKYAGNLVGATYVSRRSSDGGNGRWSTYYFSGDDLGASLSQLTRSPASAASASASQLPPGSNSKAANQKLTDSGTAQSSGGQSNHAGRRAIAQLDGTKHPDYRRLSNALSAVLKNEAEAIYGNRITEIQTNPDGTGKHVSGPSVARWTKRSSRNSRMTRVQYFDIRKIGYVGINKVCSPKLKENYGCGYEREELYRVSVSCDTGAGECVTSKFRRSNSPDREERGSDSSVWLYYCGFDNAENLVSRLQEFGQIFGKEVSSGDPGMQCSG